MIFFQEGNTIKYALISNTIFSTISLILIPPESLLRVLNETVFQAYNFVLGQREKCTWPLKITVSAEDRKPFLKSQPSGVILGLQRSWVTAAWAEATGSPLLSPEVSEPLHLQRGHHGHTL